MKGLNSSKILLLVVFLLIFAAGGVLFLGKRSEIPVRIELQPTQAAQGIQPTQQIAQPTQYVSPTIPFLVSPRDNKIDIKFVEGSGVRLREGKLISLTGQDLSQFSQVLAKYQVLKIERLFSAVSEEKLEEMKKPGIVDLNLYFRITLEKQVNSDVFIGELQGLSIVESVEKAPSAAPPPVGL